MENMKNNDNFDGFKWICVVCNSESDGQHFGQFTCKACAAFFRRSVVSNSHYICKYERKCEISKDIRNSCRHCRFHKCLIKGMIPEAVRIGPDDKNLYPIRLRKIASENNFINPNCTFTRLQKMVEGYRKFRNLRKSSFSLFIGGTNFTTWIPEYIPESNYTNAKKCVQIVESLAYDMVMEYFEPFSTLSSEDQKIIFDNFNMFFGNTEKLYNTCKAYGKIENNDRIIMGDGGYGKLDEISKCYKNSADVNADPEELAKIFSASMNYSVKVIVPAMMKAEIDDYTMTAIYAISLFNDMLANITVETREILRKAKEETIKNVHAYYCNKGLSEVELTLAVSRVLLLLPMLEQNVKSIRENFHLLDVFCMIELPTFYKQMSLN